MSKIKPKSGSITAKKSLANLAAATSSVIAVTHDEKDPAKDVTIYNAYNMGPAFGKKFSCPYIRDILKRVLTEKLTGKTYAAADAAKWTRDIADEINMRMKGKGQFPRYKNVVNVMLYQQNGAGCFYGARAVWDHFSDDYVSHTFDAGTFVCMATVFGCYTY